MTMLSETRERFLLAITAHVPPERIAEIHFFQPIKQGGVESGVAVVAARSEAESHPERNEEAPTAAPSTEEVERPPEEPDPARAALAQDDTGAAAAEDHVELPEKPQRLVVYTARYRLTLKGLDRGKWEASVVAEADAPLVTIDAVVRGVQRRAGDIDDATRMDGDDVREFIAANEAHRTRFALGTNAGS